MRISVPCFPRLTQSEDDPRDIGLRNGSSTSLGLIDNAPHSSDRCPLLGQGSPASQSREEDTIAVVWYLFADVCAVAPVKPRIDCSVWPTPSGSSVSDLPRSSRHPQCATPSLLSAVSGFDALPLVRKEPKTATSVVLERWPRCSSASDSDQCYMELLN